MKKILITGKNSYIGTSLEEWLSKHTNQYFVDTLNMKSELWKDFDFSKYDIVFHVAGLVHKKETKENKKEYFEVNRDLAFETAKKAKYEGVKQFIFLSTMNVYGIETGVIGTYTKPKPKSAYGLSKYEAEILITSLQSEEFQVAILRPPIVYGDKCKGNYIKLSKLAQITPIFPLVDNYRSMIYIDNLSEFIRLIIDNKSAGLFFPQNSEYMNTSRLVNMIARIHGKSIYMTRFFNSMLVNSRISLINKMFGDLIYDFSMSEYSENYIVCGIDDSIVQTESGFIL